MSARALVLADTSGALVAPGAKGEAMTTRVRALAGLLALSLAGCGLMTDAEPLRSGVAFTLTDGYDLNGTAQGIPAPYLTIATDAIYGCMNYPLEATVQRSGSTTAIDIEGVRKVDICLTALGPARFRTPLDLPSGTSTLVIRADGVEDRYQVTVGDSLIEIAPAAGAISRTSLPRTWRVPQNTVAARCDLSQTSVPQPAARCTAFHDSLAAVPGLARYAFGPGATPPSPPFNVGGPGADERAYRYATDAALEQAAGIMQRLARNDSSFFLSLRTWRNESRLSWWPR